MRSMLLAASQNQWLHHRAAHYPFVRRSVSRFMTGETLDDLELFDPARFAHRLVAE